MATFTHTISVETPPAQLWTLVRDVRRVAELFPYTAIEEFTSPEPDRWLFRRQLSIPNIADLHWREDARVVSGRELCFQAVEGDLSTFAGSWRVATDGADATLTLSLEYVIPEAVAPKMPTMLVDYVMGEIFKTICQRIKEVAEEG